MTLLVTRTGEGGTVVRLTTRETGVDTVRGELAVRPGPLRLGVRTSGQDYVFSVTQEPEGRRDVGTVDGRFLSSQVAGVFTGVYLGPYARGPGAARARPDTTGSATAPPPEEPPRGHPRGLHGRAPWASPPGARVPAPGRPQGAPRCHPLPLPVSARCGGAGRPTRR